MATITPNTTASGAANAGLHALADRIEEAQGRAICISVESADYLREALAASAPAPQPAVPLTDTFVQTVPDKCDRIVWRNSYYHLPIAAAPKAAPAINPRTQYLTVVYRGVEAGDEARVICDHPKVSAVSWSHALDDRDAALAAAPKTDPAINKVNNIIDAYGMTPGQPERVADIPGLAEALEAAFADGSAQITGALQQGEYLPLPDADTHCYDEDTGKDVWSHSAEQMHAYVDADRDMRAAPHGDVAAWLVLADGEPHHVTPGKSDDAARLWAEEQTKCGAPYSFTFLPLCPPAAPPQGAPITDAEQAAWHAGLDEGRSQVRAPLQQGEYLPLPEPSGRIEYPAQRYEDAWVSTQDAYSEEQMRAYVDADRATKEASNAG